MTVYAFRTSNYAQNIYRVGSYSFSTIPAEYVQPVKQYAADHYCIDDIDTALANGWITQQEYDETIALKGPEDPQYRPQTMMVQSTEETI